jgi:hypothetical protein
VATNNEQWSDHKRNQNQKAKHLRYLDFSADYESNLVEVLSVWTLGVDLEKSELFENTPFQKAKLNVWVNNLGAGLKCGVIVR